MAAAMASKWWRAEKRLSRRLRISARLPRKRRVVSRGVLGVFPHFERRLPDDDDGLEFRRVGVSEAAAINEEKKKRSASTARPVTEYSLAAVEVPALAARKPQLGEGVRGGGSNGVTKVAPI